MERSRPVLLVYGYIFKSVCFSVYILLQSISVHNYKFFWELYMYVFAPYVWVNSAAWPLKLSTDRPLYLVKCSQLLVGTKHWWGVQRGLVIIASSFTQSWVQFLSGIFFFLIIVIACFHHVCFSHNHQTHHSLWALDQMHWWSTSEVCSSLISSIVKRH